jgi:hypothetical protein
MIKLAVSFKLLAFGFWLLAWAKNSGFLGVISFFFEKSLGK